MIRVVLKKNGWECIGEEWERNMRLIMIMNVCVLGERE